MLVVSQAQRNENAPRCSTSLRDCRKTRFADLSAACCWSPLMRSPPTSNRPSIRSNHNIGDSVACLARSNPSYAAAWWILVPMSARTLDCRNQLLNSC